MSPSLRDFKKLLIASNCSSFHPKRLRAAKPVRKKLLPYRFQHLEVTILPTNMMTVKLSNYATKTAKLSKVCVSCTSISHRNCQISAANSRIKPSLRIKSNYLCVVTKEKTNTKAEKLRRCCFPWLYQGASSVEWETSESGLLVFSLPMAISRSIIKVKMNSKMI